MFEVNEMPQQVPPDTLAELSQISSATVGHKRQEGFPDRRIRPLFPGQKIVGTAVTLSLAAQDSTLLHHAVGFLRPGDILVIDRLGDDRYACLGGGVGKAASVTGAVGAIIDGPCTDPDELAELNFPVWCRGVSALTTRLQGIGGVMNGIISCGGTPVRPGDAIIADDSGIAVIPPHLALKIAKDGIAKEKRGEKLYSRLRHGEKFGTLTGATAKVLDNLAPSS